MTTKTKASQAIPADERGIAEQFLLAVTRDIMEYTAWCRMYGDKKFSHKELGHKVRALRKVFFHSGKPHEIEAFNKKHEELNQFLNQK